MRTKDFSISPVQKKAPGIKAWRLNLFGAIFEAFQLFCADWWFFRALVENEMSGATAALAFGIMAVSVAGAALFWYLAHNSEGHANYQMCAGKTDSHWRAYEVYANGLLQRAELGQSDSGGYVDNG